MSRKPKRTAADVANYFLNWVNKEGESGEVLTNLKLQKLVYYAQGFALAILGRPLFKEPIEAWGDGPAVPALFYEYENDGIIGDTPPPPPENYTASEWFDKDEIKLLTDVFLEFGQYSAWRLRDMAYAEPTWKEAWDSRKGKTEVITHRKLKEYFSTRIQG